MTTMRYSGANWLTTNWLTTNWLTLTARGAVHTQIVHDVIARKVVHTQIVLAIYNVINFRVLWEIASDGITAGNYSASSSASSDKAIANVKTDILEQYWQSTGLTGQWLQFDAGAGRTISMDTLALLATNITSSASLVLKGYGSSADAGPVSWAAVPVYANVLPPDDRPTDDRIFWIAPDLPIEEFRHWRLEIDDPTNGDGFLRIGRVLGGASTVLAGENITEEIDVELIEYKEELRLNGFTGIANTRALKQRVTVRLDDLNVLNKNNHQQLVKMFSYARGTLKILAIPDPMNPYDYSAFGKMDRIPKQNHKFIDAETRYATYEITIDEAL